MIQRERERFLELVFFNADFLSFIGQDVYKNDKNYNKSKVEIKCGYIKRLRVRLGLRLGSCNFQATALKCLVNTKCPFGITYLKAISAYLIV